MTTVLNVAVVGLALAAGGAQASTLLYSQNFNNPNQFVNNDYAGGPKDVDPFTTVNGAYGTSRPASPLARRGLWKRCLWAAPGPGTAKDSRTLQVRRAATFWACSRACKTTWWV